MLRIAMLTLALGLSAGGVAAQGEIRFGYFAGVTKEIQDQPGLAAGLSLTVPTPLSFASLRIEGMFQQAHYRDIFAMADFLVRPLPARPTFYVIGGYGFFLDGGGEFGPINWAWNAGAGVDLSQATSLPIFLEYRTFFARAQFSALGVGVHF